MRRCPVRPSTPATLSAAVTSTPATGSPPAASTTTSTGPVMKISSSAMPSSENAASSSAEPPSSPLQRLYRLSQSSFVSTALSFPTAPARYTASVKLTLCGMSEITVSSAIISPAKMIVICNTSVQVTAGIPPIVV